MQLGQKNSPEVKGSVECLEKADTFSMATAQTEKRWVF